MTSMKDSRDILPALSECVPTLSAYGYQANGVGVEEVYRNCMAAIFCRMKNDRSAMDTGSTCRTLSAVTAALEAEGIPHAWAVPKGNVSIQLSARVDGTDFELRKDWPDGLRIRDCRLAGGFHQTEMSVPAIIGFMKEYAGTAAYLSRVLPAMCLDIATDMTVFRIRQATKGYVSRRVRSIEERKARESAVLKAVARQYFTERLEGCPGTVGTSSCGPYVKVRITLDDGRLMESPVTMNSLQDTADTAIGLLSHQERLHGCTSSFTVFLTGCCG